MSGMAPCKPASASWEGMPPPPYAGCVVIVFVRVWVPVPQVPLSKLVHVPHALCV